MKVLLITINKGRDAVTWSRGQPIKPISRVRVLRGLLNPNPYPYPHIPVASTRTGFQTRDIPYPLASSPLAAQSFGTGFSTGGSSVAPTSTPSQCWMVPTDPSGACSCLTTPPQPQSGPGSVV